MSVYGLSLCQVQTQLWTGRSHN